MIVSPLTRLADLGQSIWLDYIRRDLVRGGELARLIAEDGLAGMTSNPAIFEQAILGSPDYDADIAQLARAGHDATAIYAALSMRDVQDAAAAFHPVYVASSARDGYVSLEVDPRLAHDTAATVADGRRLWRALDRPNVCIKVPATSAGIDAIRQLIAAGINVNVTLLFGLSRYAEVAEAYLTGLEQRAASGAALASICSVASFFISRIDTLVDPRLATLAAADGEFAAIARQLQGEVAIAAARRAYHHYQAIVRSPRFQRLAAAGAQPQRLLWASTSTKNPAYAAVKYVEALIGPNTVNTVPLETLKLYREHGNPQSRLLQETPPAALVMSQLVRLGIDMETVATQLEAEAIAKFVQPFTKLLTTLAAKAEQFRANAS